MAELKKKINTNMSLSLPLSKKEIDLALSQQDNAFSAQNIKILDSEQITKLKFLIGNGENLEIWETPRHWVPITTASRATLYIDLKKRITKQLPLDLQHLAKCPMSNSDQPDVDSDIFNIARKSRQLLLNQILSEAILSINRYLLLLRIGPVGLGRRRNLGSLDPSTIKSIAYRCMPLLASLVIIKIFERSEEPKLTNSERKPIFSFELLTDDDLKSCNPSQNRALSLEVFRMRTLSERGYWVESPKPSTSGISIFSSPQERDYSKQRVIETHLPLPDSYVAEMGKHSLWLIEELAPQLLIVAEQIKYIWAETSRATDHEYDTENMRRKKTKILLSKIVWRDRKGVEITNLPFNTQGFLQHTLSRPPSFRDEQITQDTSHRDVDLVGSGPLAWPPRIFSDVARLLATVQHAHLFVVCLSTGARVSEVLSFTRSCLQEARDGTMTAVGKTYKLVQKFEGETRDWIIPDVATRAIIQQIDLAKIAEQIGHQGFKGRVSVAKQERSDSEHLWIQLPGTANGNRCMPLTNLRTALVRFALTLGMEVSPGGQNFRPHRFRKTIARLVALSLTQAPKVLMDVFGHKAIEMTLYYILADKALQADVEKVCRELRIVRATEIIEDMVAQEDLAEDGFPNSPYGGPASAKISHAISAHRQLVHKGKEEWGSETVQELAEILTLNGKAWNLVRRGIICTKFPGTESGPCNDSKGQPEPARCKSRCTHRLEEKFLRADVEDSLDEALKLYIQAREDGNDLIEAHWAAQIRSNVRRFEDLKRKYMRNDIVKNLMSDLI
ncbi:tyrosine-type recombinase/integrase [Oxalobacteraceae sp. CFBP 8763]|nr:tyrosine-type recombinase/integrase [Oxalobacteraceae sp. CFBP 8763]